MSTNSGDLENTEPLAANSQIRPDTSNVTKHHQELMPAETELKVTTGSDVFDNKSLYEVSGHRRDMEAPESIFVPSDEHSQLQEETLGRVTSAPCSSHQEFPVADNHHKPPDPKQQSLTGSTLVHEHLAEQATLPKSREHDTVPKNLEHVTVQGYSEHVTLSKSAAAAAVPTGELSVPEFYSGKYVLITGATGFIGKVLIEKLLRCCPALECIYCLVRPKNKQTIQTRLDEITNSRLFDRLRKERPHFASQLRPVCGDILLPNLGLSEADCHMLKQNVHIVFHSAATVRFDEPLRMAVEMNVKAVRKILNLCRSIRHLEALVHVSTAFANCDRPYIEETVYPPPVEPQKIIDVLEWMDDEILKLFTPKLMGEKPNTYTYTKQLAEHLLVTEGADLPIAIVRPSIVGAAWKEPFPGWIDNYNGPSGIYIAVGRGILRSMKGESKASADIVPVDIPVNVMIAVAWYTAIAKPKNILIYHATTGGAKPFTWGDIGDVVNKSFKHTPLEGCFRRPNVAIVSNNNNSLLHVDNIRSFLHEYWTCVSHLFPAYIYDIAFRLIGKKPRMVKLYHKLHRSIDCLKFFTLNEWHWANSNQYMLRQHLSPADQKIFYFDMHPLHWPTYIENYCLGAKKYVLNEDVSGLPAARAHMRRLQIIRYVFNSAVAIILWRVLIAKSQFARNLWFFIVGLVFKFVQYFRITSTMQKS